jgi:hypothetical protein
MDLEIKKFINSSQDQINLVISKDILSHANFIDDVVELVSQGILEKDYEDHPGCFAFSGLPWWGEAFGLELDWDEDAGALVSSDPEKENSLAKIKYPAIKRLFDQHIRSLVRSDWKSILAQRKEIETNYEDGDFVALRKFFMIVDSFLEIEFYDDGSEDFNLIRLSMLNQLADRTYGEASQIIHTAELPMSIRALQSLKDNNGRIFVTGTDYVDGYNKGAIGLVFHLDSCSNSEKIANELSDLASFCGLANEIGLINAINSNFELVLKGQFERYYPEACYSLKLHKALAEEADA